jgi:hypothetical protein
MNEEINKIKLNKLKYNLGGLYIYSLTVHVLYIYANAVAHPVDVVIPQVRIPIPRPLVSSHSLYNVVSI